MPLNTNKWKITAIPDLSRLNSIKLKYYEGQKTKATNNDEELVNLKNYHIAGCNHYYSLYNPPYFKRIEGSFPLLLSRKKVAEALSQANQLLEAEGLEIWVYDAWRPIAVQNYFYFNWFPKYLRQTYPEKNDGWIVKETEKYWSRGAKTLEDACQKPPPHSTGGAVDVTLRRKECKQLLEMGSIFDDVTEIAHLDFLEKHQKNSLLNFTQTEALHNRRLLFHVMTKVGFSCNPTEWWHFSLGDQIWALFTESAKPLYGYAGKLAGEKWT